MIVKNTLVKNYFYTVFKYGVLGVLLFKDKYTLN